MFSTLTVLYVEDEELIADVVMSIFTTLFKKTIHVSNGFDGLEEFKKYKDEIDIIITDINMPKMDGIEMCTHIREIDTQTPIIITTTYNDKDFLHKAIEIGISKFVTKPMDMKVLIDGISKSIEPILLQQKFALEKKHHEEERIKTAKFSAIGELAAGITHEINTPLTYVKANLELLGYDLEDLEESKVKKNIKDSILKISTGLNRIENIVNSMKEMYNTTEKNKKQVNIYSTIITATTLAYNKIKHISKIYINHEEFDINTNKHELQFMASVELQRIEQVWIIILNNAMDELAKIPTYEDRKLDVFISENNEEVTVIFKDNAGGIDKDILKNLFEPFKGTKSYSGMGIGLSIAKKIIEEQENCTIEAFNEDNGAVFKIVIKKDK